MKQSKSAQVSRFDVWLVNLNPTQGREINKTRPCVVVSPDEMAVLSTVLMVPITTKGFELPCRVPCTFQKKKGLLLLDQMREIDKSRLVKKLGSINTSNQAELCDCLQELFRL